LEVFVLFLLPDVTGMESEEKGKVMFSDVSGREGISTTDFFELDDLEFNTIDISSCFTGFGKISVEFFSLAFILDFDTEDLLCSTDNVSSAK